MACHQRRTVEMPGGSELQILKLLAKGNTNQEIAGELFLALGTVQNYVSSIFVKLNVNDRTQAAALAWREGLVE